MNHHTPIAEPSERLLRRRFLVSATLLAMLGTALAGALSCWLARVTLERRLLEAQTQNLARLVQDLRLPASPRLLDHLRQVTDCHVAVTERGRLLHATLPELTAEHLVAGDRLSLPPHGAFFVASQALDDQRRLWLLLPRQVASQTLRDTSLTLIAITAVAGTAALALALLAARAHARLVARVRDADRRLSRAEATAMATRLSSSVVHELRNPLAGIRMNAQVLAEDAGDDPAIRDSLQLIIGDIDRIDQFLRSLTDVSANVIASQPPPSQTPPLRTLLRGVTELLGGRYRQAGVRLRLELPESLPLDGPSPCPELPLRQILVNLLTNALEASTSGSEVTLSARHLPTGGLELTVRDQGRGVHPEDGEDIFAPFVSHKPNGCGLGLHISRQLAAASGATLDWRNPPDGGAAFTLRFPST
ncbi:MAG: sensor histidine kinase [Oligosphaeraceae bacterium]